MVRFSSRRDRKIDMDDPKQIRWELEQAFQGLGSLSSHDARVLRQVLGAQNGEATVDAAYRVMAELEALRTKVEKT